MDETDRLKREINRLQEQLHILSATDAEAAQHVYVLEDRLKNETESIGLSDIAEIIETWNRKRRAISDQIQQISAEIDGAESALRQETSFEESRKVPIPQTGEAGFDEEEWLRQRKLRLERSRPKR